MKDLGPWLVVPGLGTTTGMRIDIFSDPICPWCFIGKRRLARALRSRHGLRPTVAWRAFQLNPAMPKDGMDRQHYLSAKFGSAAEAQRLYSHIAQVGLTEGIDFRFDRIAVTPNTVDAHRLIRLAGDADQDQAGEMVEALFCAYFIDGRDIGDRATLASIAAEVGLDRRTAEDYLAGDDAADTIRGEDLHGRQLGVEVVPYFIVDSRYALPGAQEPEAFLSIFDMVAEHLKTAANAD